MLKKKIWASFQRIIELFTQKFVTKLQKNMGLGSGIRKKTYSGSGSRGQKDPGSGSATLIVPMCGSTTHWWWRHLGMRREDLAVHVRRDAVFEDSFRELHRRTAEEWKNRFYIVFEGKTTGCRPPPPPLPLQVAMAVRNHLNEEIIPLLPTGLGERYSQTISHLGHAALLRRCELPL